MIEEGFAVENIAFGMGGALLQKVDRDTQKFAIKCSSIVINDEEVEVQKNPIEINEKGERVQSFKKSKAGRLKLVHHIDEYNNSDEYETVQHCKDFTGDILVNIFENGHILKEWTFEEVRERAEVKINVEELV
jgi:nicotinamide phosphoribosyltransferase